MTGGSAATKAIMMMVQALRPKITRNSGYISTNGAEATAATQVSVASRTIRQRCSSTPSEMPTTVSIRLAASASPQVSRKRGSTCSSRMMRSKLHTISDGFGTMKGLIRPALISASITATSASRQADPNTNGTASRRIMERALTGAWLRRAPCATRRP